MRLMLFALLAGLLAAGCGDDPVPGDDATWTFVNPLLDAKVGEWALYRQGDTEIRYQVLGVNEALRTVEIEEVIRRPDVDELVSDVIHTRNMNHFLWGYESAGAVLRSLRRDQVRVLAVARENASAGEHEFTCLKIEYAGGVPGALVGWFSNEVPVLGIVRQQVTGMPEPNVVLIDWSGRR